MPLVFAPSVINTSTGVTLKALRGNGAEFPVHVNMEAWETYGHAEVMLKANAKDASSQREEDGSIVIGMSDFDSRR